MADLALSFWKLSSWSEVRGAPGAVASSSTAPSLGIDKITISSLYLRVVAICVSHFSLP